MVLWKYIEILKKPDKTLFLSKDTTKEKFAALDKVAKYGSPNDISSIIFVLKSKNKLVREEACGTIIHLFGKIKNKKGYYNVLKYCEISTKDIDYYADKFISEQLAYLLAVSSLNHNGYVREKAILSLSKISNSKAIRFLIYRLADWVLPVRESAKKALSNYITKEYIDDLIENLPVIEWLQKVERINLDDIYNSLIEFIILTNRDYTIANYKKYPDKLRFLIAKHISSSLRDTSELSLLLKDKHFTIRNLALNHFGKLKEEDISLLLRDKSSKIRLNTLYALKEREDFSTVIIDFLADESSSIRHLARFTLKDSAFDFAEFYNLQLQNDNQIVGSLLGLAEVDACQYSKTVEAYLYSKKVKIKKAALLALIKLDKESAYNYAIANIGTTIVGLRRIIIDFLSTNYSREVLRIAQKCYEKGNEELKISMLNLFNKIGGWEALSDLMIATIDNNENIRSIGKQHIETWRVRATSLYATPSKNDLDRIKNVFEFANKTHKNKKYFEQNPLEGLNFYFR